MKFPASDQVEINQQSYRERRGEDGECEQYGTARKESKHADNLVDRETTLPAWHDMPELAGRSIQTASLAKPAASHRQRSG
jgi:hypothetical protein